MPNLVRDNSFSKTAICSCKPDTLDPCGPTSDCENRSLQIECSVSLEIHVNQNKDTNQTLKIKNFIFLIKKFRVTVLLAKSVRIADFDFVSML